MNGADLVTIGWLALSLAAGLGGVVVGTIAQRHTSSRRRHRRS